MSDVAPAPQSTELLPDPLVLPALFTTKGLLADLAQHDSFATAIALAFGDQSSSSAFTDVQQQWISGHWQAPAIAILSAQELNGARGAYASETDTIYLSREFVLASVSQPDLLVDVLLEEVGHYLDDQINSVDALGDEGAIFAQLVRHQTIAPNHLHQLQQHNDHSTIQLNGHGLAVENADFTGTNLKSALISSLGTLIDNIKSLINNDVLQGLPLLGNALGIANPFDTVLNNFRDQIITRLNAIPANGSVTEVQQALFQVLGSGGLGILRDRPEDANTTVSADDIIIDVAADGSKVEFKLAIGKQMNSTLPLTSDLGLPFFGLTLNGSATSNLDVGVNLDFGIDATTGFFVNTAASDREVEINLST
ncbi:MAG: hypothetical protein SFY66_19500 [Oculatellaceae cyanobacterium bins.114]|nr:hypothetical protein [Oculatellaceae cyanobacterium bins.114]